MIRVVLIDDQKIIRQELRKILNLEANLLVVGDASNGAEGLIKVRELQPDLVLVDVRMPGLDGINTTILLKQTWPNCSIIILSVQDDYETRKRAEEVGVTFVSKQGVPNLLASIQQVVSKDLTCEKPS